MRRLVPITSAVWLASCVLLSLWLEHPQVERMPLRVELAPPKEPAVAQVENSIDIAAREWLTNFDELNHARPAMIRVESWGLPPPSEDYRLLIDRALILNDDESWDRALAKKHLAGPYLVQSLDDKQNEVINRAALGLARSGYWEGMPELIEHLETKHTLVIGNFGVGVEPGDLHGGKVMETTLKNAGVRRALTTLSNGQDFGFDRNAWRKWYIDSRTPKEVNLRRRP